MKHRRHVLATSLPPSPPLVLLLLLLLPLPPSSAATPSPDAYFELPIYPAGDGFHLVSLPLGSPPQPLPLLLHTTSRLLWSLCSVRHPRRPATFHPLLSSSFLPLPCSPARRCPRRYSSSHPSSSGLLALDSATFPTAAATAQLRFGCALNSSGLPLPAAGVLPLGRGPSSLPAQLLRRRFLPSRSFSYCLPSRSPASLALGLHPRHRHPRLVFTPLLRSPLSPASYYVSLEAILIDGNQLAIDPKLFDLDPRSGAGGTVVDSATAVSFLPAPAYRRVLASMERLLRLPRVTVSRGADGFDLCVNVTGVGGRELPRMGLRMRGGAVMLPPPRNYFVPTTVGVRCLAVQPVEDGAGVIGSLMQQGYLMVFDRELDRLGFSRSGCTAAA